MLERQIDRRAERRQMVLKEGKVMLSDWVSVDCVVRDISPGGARLEFQAPVSLPSEFRLRIVSADLTIPATAAWQRRLEAGISFTGVGTVGAVDNSPKKIVRSAA
jgi:hypothetical protein